MIPLKTIEKERMTQKEFNEKYKDFIEEGYSGMELINETLIWYIDKMMKTLIKIPEFKLHTITYKFGSYYFRSNQDNSTLDDFIECGIRDTAIFIDKYEEEIENQQRWY